MCEKEHVVYISANPVPENHKKNSDFLKIYIKNDINLKGDWKLLLSTVIWQAKNTV